MLNAEQRSNITVQNERPKNDISDEETNIQDEGITIVLVKIRV